MKLKRIAITIEGIPGHGHLQNRFTDEAAEASTSGTSSSGPRDQLTPLEDARQRLYLDDKGRHIVTTPALMKLLMDAGRFHKCGRSKVTTNKSSLVPAAVTFLEAYHLLESTTGWKVDTRPVRIPATGGRILRHRPCFDHWSVAFTVLLDTTVISLKLFRQIVDDGGIKIGFSDFNPFHSGFFGKYKVIAWTAVDEDADESPAEEAA